MSQSVTSSMNIGCPHCGSASTVDIAPDGQGQAESDDQLKGTLVRCQSCGDDFSFYYY
ncbi:MULTISPECIES: zinc-ribbon domain-containing protein [unclassified Haladaptatus]|uniref:zinc-ribbon domain-containing protein n=1 Tax=unclassified Haladaptatus TaxID=2622732 RepID=UPI001CC09515|nr:zinc-ribbon domain-containing protein [Haladaptatus sp. R4]